MDKIIILHGWTYKLDKWKNFLKSLGKAGFSIKILKIPGLTQQSNEVWDLDKYVEWLDKIIKKEKLKVILLGHSNGGRIATAYVFKYPEKIKKLVLIDSAGIYHKELYLGIKRLLFKVAAKIGKKFSGSPFLRKLLYALAREKDYYNAPESTKKTMLNMVKSDIEPMLDKINIPTLIIWGSEDKTTPLSDARIFKKLIPKSKLEIIHGARHTPFYTNTREVVRIVKNDI